MIESLVAWISSYEVYSRLIAAGIVGLMFYILIIKQRKYK